MAMNLLCCCLVIQVYQLVNLLSRSGCVYVCVSAFACMLVSAGSVYLHAYNYVFMDVCVCVCMRVCVCVRVCMYV